jgi:aminoglycoside phosphotransferase (APT) family kinase protein
MTAIDVPAVDPDRLSGWLRDHVAELVGSLRVEQLSGGASNLTFRVRDDIHDWVLRRPPLRRVLKTAYDMSREYRVQAALAGTDVPVPAMVAYCEEDDAVGAPFYLMEMLDGVVYADADSVAHLSAEQARAAAFELVDVLARLHAINPDVVGLGDFGRPEGFLSRQVRRWRAQWEASRTREVPAIDEVLARLEQAVPPEIGLAIVHGDYSFHNTMWDAGDPTRLIAVLDWEMSTRGDPLTDLGTLLSFWGEAGELMWQNRRPQPHRLNPGFPTDADLVDRYALASAVQLDRLEFYRALATIKLAIICQGSLTRTSHDEEQAARTAQIVEALAALAYEHARAA